ncbi:MAG TPA: hypothetical protein VK669_00630 [Candidatus Limnocylindrales bacterium]|nr:hypothetical protein [Candidatus Limnocylindrales bacterium]
MSNDLVYISDLIIEDTELLSTLLLINDKVMLPHPYDIDPAANRLISWPFDKLPYLEWEQNRYTSWKEKNQTLFAKDILSVLPPPIEADKLPANVDGRLREQLGITSTLLASSFALDGSLAIAMHALFADTRSVPEFSSEKSISRTVAALGRATFVRRYPKLPGLTADQILELRSATERYREGFRLYLTSLTEKVENREASGSAEETAALQTFEQTIEPEVQEYLRRELPDRIRWWATIVRTIASESVALLTIVTNPWSLENYPKLVENPAALLETMASRASERASNKHQAFQYIGKLDRVAH